MSTSHGEYRRHPRTGIRTDISLDLEDTDLATKTRDISYSGMAITKPSSISLEPGQSISVSFNRLPNLKVPARVVRVAGDQIGLELDHVRLSELDLENIIETAPVHQRWRVYLKRSTWKLMRRSGIFLVNTILRRPLLAFTKPTFLFAVYGNEEDASTYYTPTMLKLMPPLMLGSIIRNKKFRGLMVASKYYEHELEQNSDKVKNYLQQLKDEFGHIETIALVGRLPNFVMKAGIKIEKPYVDGSMGTRYMIWDTGCQMREYEQYKNENTITVLGGAGRIGNLVCNDLAQEYSTVIAFDPRYKQDEHTYTPIGKVIRTSNPNYFNQCKLYICLMHHGDVITELMPFIPSEAMIADDTHPCISLAVREQLAQINIHVQKTVLSHEDFSTWPRFPAWSNRDIPGCLVEALVIMERPDVDVSDFNQFKQVAKEAGFFGKLVKPLDE